MNFEKRILADGRATLYRGDCLELLRADVLGAADVLLTDPPYEIRNKFGVMDRGAKKGVRRLEFPWDADGVTRELVTPSLELIAPKVRHAAVVFCGAEQFGVHAATFRSAGLTAKPAVWVKPYPPPPARGNWWPSAHENIVYAYRKGARFFDDSPYRCNVFVADSLRYGRAEKAGHPNQKPLDLLRYLARSVTPAGGLILDPYMGSGSTGVVALSLGMTFIGCEIDPAHFEIACQRIEAAHDQAAC